MSAGSARALGVEPDQDDWDCFDNRFMDEIGMHEDRPIMDPDCHSIILDGCSRMFHTTKIKKSSGRKIRYEN